MPRIADRGRHRPYVAELGTAGETTTTAIDTADTTNTTHCIHYGVPVLVGAQWKAKSPVSGTWSTSHKVLCSITVQCSQGSNEEKKKRRSNGIGPRVSSRLAPAPGQASWARVVAARQGSIPIAHHPGGRL